MSFITILKKYKHIFINVLVAAVFFGGGYFTHALTSGSRVPSGFPDAEGFGATDGNMPAMGRAGNGGAMPSGIRATSGTIVSNSGSYITIKLSNGSTKNVYISDSSTIYSRSKTSADQLTADKKVTVQGDTNSDNSIQGTTITIE